MMSVPVAWWPKAVLLAVLLCLLPGVVGAQESSRDETKVTFQLNDLNPEKPPQLRLAPNALTFFVFDATLLRDSVRLESVDKDAVPSFKVMDVGARTIAMMPGRALRKEDQWVMRLEVVDGEAHKVVKFRLVTVAEEVQTQVFIRGLPRTAIYWHQEYSRAREQNEALVRFWRELVDGAVAAKKPSALVASVEQSGPRVERPFGFIIHDQVVLIMTLCCPDDDIPWRLGDVVRREGTEEIPLLAAMEGSELVPGLEVMALVRVGRIGKEDKAGVLVIVRERAGTRHLQLRLKRA